MCVTLGVELSTEILLDLNRPQESQTCPAKKSESILLLQSVSILETALQTYNLRNEEAFSQQRGLEEIRNVSGLSGQSSEDRW